MSEVSKTQRKKVFEPVVSFIKQKNVNEPLVLKILLGFECKRCTRNVENEEARYLLGGFYCRACMNTIENDPDYENTLFAIAHLKNIEN